ncbi:MAG: carboxypeptidase regulatory-like domain-containing protein, partial [Candidatus Cloacimonetes bacterium]|nr:carboxypeptidase regulatory-like domain-containing protein [Candidatus Cloacimonadota bacterium]
NYEICLIDPADYSLLVTSHGYYDKIVDLVTISANKVTIQDIIIEAIPPVSVSGTITAQGSGEAVENAIVTLVGYDSFETVSDVNGDYAFDVVSADNSYRLDVMADGYDTERANITIESSDVTQNFTLKNPPANNVLAVQDSALDLTWQMLGSYREFRKDDGVPRNQTGGKIQELNKVHGTCFREKTLLNELSWYLKGNFAQHQFVNLLVFALDNNGMPDSNQLLYQVNDVPTIDDQWNTHEMSELITAPNGFFFCVNTPGIYTGLGLDTATEPYLYEANTYLYNDNWTVADGWHQDPYRKNYMLRAKGYGYGEVASSREAVTYEVRRGLAGDEANVDQWTVLATDLTEMKYTDSEWGNLETGYYRYAVYANYESGATHPVFSNKCGINGKVTFNVTTNDGASAEGATIKFICYDYNPDHNYEAVVGADGTAVFEDVWLETYYAQIKLSGYRDYTENDIVVAAATDTNVDIELLEKINLPTNLDLSDITDNSAIL